MGGGYIFLCLRGIVGNIVYSLSIYFFQTILLFTRSFEWNSNGSELNKQRVFTYLEPRLHESYLAFTYRRSELFNHSLFV